MKNSAKLLAGFFFSFLFLCMINSAVFGQENPEFRFAENVIEVPMGTEIEIDEESGTVAIPGSDYQIEKGDTFVVYVQGLPVAYRATDVYEDDHHTVITAKSAGKDVYQYIDQEGYYIAGA